jgi:hypothetical protein
VYFKVDRLSGLLTLVRINGELLERESSGSGVENRY